MLFTPKKLSVAIAVLGLMLSGLSSAVDLKIYGVAHGSLDYVDDGVNSDPYVASNSSRLGFKGSQKLKNTGIEAIFQYEQGVDLTGQGSNDGNGGPGNESGGLFTNARDSWVGLSGKVGAVKLGRVGGLNQWVYDYNLFADQVGDLGNIWGASGLAGRVSNSISYDMPQLGNFSGTLVYQPEEGSPDTDITVVKANFGMKAIKAGLGYMSQGTGGPNDQQAVAITASFSTDKFSIGGGYQDESDRGGVSGSDGNSITLGGSFNIGAGKLKAQVTTFSDDAPNADATQIAVGYDYDLGGATVYIAYAQTDNDANVSYTANNYGHGDAVTPLPGNDPSVVSLGLIYSFEAGL